MNLGIGWGLGKERAVEAVQREARGVVVGAEMRRRSYRGVVDVVYGGEKPVVEEKVKGKNQGGKGGKRKAGDSVDAAEMVVDEAEKPPSKRELKRRAAKARKAVAIDKAGGPDNAVEESATTKENDYVATANSKDQG